MVARVGDQKSDGESIDVVVRDALDDPHDPDPITGGDTHESLMLVKGGVHAEVLLDSNDYLMSVTFTTAGSDRDFMSFENTAIAEFKRGDDDKPKRDVILYKFNAEGGVLSKGMGRLVQKKSDGFNTRYDRLFREATAF